MKHSKINFKNTSHPALETVGAVSRRCQYCIKPDMVTHCRRAKRGSMRNMWKTAGILVHAACLVYLKIFPSEGIIP